MARREQSYSFDHLHVTLQSGLRRWNLAHCLFGADKEHFSAFVLFFRCIVIWAQVTACRLRQQEALCYFRRVREQHLLEVSFAEWRVKFMTAKQQLLGEEKSHTWHGCSQGKACQRWRLASRGQQALHLGSVATVKQVRRKSS